MRPDQPAVPAEQRGPEFPYGWRFVRRTQPDGTTEVEQVALTLEDVLHPQEGDIIAQHSRHEMECGYLTGVFRSRPLRPPIVRVSSDLLIDWGVPGQRDTAPDVGVFVGLKQEPDLTEGTFHLRASGGRCLLVVENVSPHTRENDVVHKHREYFKAGVPLYVVVDQEKEGGPRHIRGFQRTSLGWEQLASDPQGLLLEPLGLFLALDEQDRLVCFDEATGRQLGDYVHVAHELEEADRRNQEQEKALEDSALFGREQVQAREAAERLAREQTQAREAAERLAREQTQAREAAERLALEQTQARQEAERREREQQQARKEAERKQQEALEASERLAIERKQALEAAEERIRKLEAALQRQEGASPP